MKVNKSLFWESNVKGEWDTWSEKSRKAYVERVLTWGARNDIVELGFSTIRTYLPELRLPKHIREFWESYFEEEDRNGNTYRTAEKNHSANS
jgi:hypothetical protein